MRTVVEAKNQFLVEVCVQHRVHLVSLAHHDQNHPSNRINVAFLPEGASVGAGEMNVGAGVGAADGAGVAKAGISSFIATKSPPSSAVFVSAHDPSVSPARSIVPSDPGDMALHQSLPAEPSC